MYRALNGNSTGGQVTPLKNIVIMASGTYRTYLKVKTAYDINTLEIAQYTYSHVIESYGNYPSEGTRYSNFNNPCPYAIDIAVGSTPGSGGGMYFNCEVTIDGRSYS